MSNVNFDYHKFYNRNQIMQNTNITRSSVEKLVSDLKPIKLGGMIVYKGIDLLIKLNPDDEELKLLHRNLSSYEQRIINIKGS